MGPELSLGRMDGAKVIGRGDSRCGAGAPRQAAAAAPGTSAMSFAPSTGLLRSMAKGGPRLAAPQESPTTPVSARRSPPEPGTVAVAIAGPVDRADVARLCERIRVLLAADDADLVVCDVGALVAADAATVDVLARLQLTARRRGGRMRIRHASSELLDLLALMGLREVLPTG
jgi:ABC-type transporter Mla MlaB component